MSHYFRKKSLAIEEVQKLIKAKFMDKITELDGARAGR